MVRVMTLSPGQGTKPGNKAEGRRAAPDRPQVGRFVGLVP